MPSIANEPVPRLSILATPAINPAPANTNIAAAIYPAPVTTLESRSLAVLINPEALLMNLDNAVPSSEINPLKAFPAPDINPPRIPPTNSPIAMPTIDSAFAPFSNVDRSPERAPIMATSPVIIPKNVARPRAPSIAPFTGTLLTMRHAADIAIIRMLSAIALVIIESALGKELRIPRTTASPPMANTIGPI